MKQFNLKTKSVKSLFLLLALLLGGTSPTWADTKTEGFNTNNTYPEGWSSVGSISFDADRKRGSSGYALATSGKDATSNYIITEAIEGTLTLYFRSYGTSSS